MIAAIGDVHGCADELRQLLATVVGRFGENSGEIIMLGDYVDRGPDTLGVLQTLRDFSHPRIKLIMLRGNHDEMMIKSTLYGDHHLRGVWLNLDSGGNETVRSLGSDLSDWARWLEDTCVYQHRIGGLLFVHAGIRPGRLLADQSLGDMMWIRGDFLKNEKPYEDGVVVVHGHTVVWHGADICPNRLALDTGCVFGGTLTAALWDDDEQLIGFESVPGYDSGFKALDGQTDQSS